ncbi:MAG: hypothetical protein ACQEP5_06915 [Actinomycetota bacterium]
MEYLKEISIEGIADEVYLDLSSLEVEDVWDQSGSTRYGYIDPVDMAGEMFEEALEPYKGELEKYQRLGMRQEAKKYCLGMLKGIYRFEKECETKFREWAEDIPEESFDRFFNTWKKSCKSPGDIKEVEEYIKDIFSGWAVNGI